VTAEDFRRVVRSLHGRAEGNDGFVDQRPVRAIQAAGKPLQGQTHSLDRIAARRRLAREIGEQAGLARLGSILLRFGAPAEPAGGDGEHERGSQAGDGGASATALGGSNLVRLFDLALFLRVDPPLLLGHTGVVVGNRSLDKGANVVDQRMRTGQ
jgi:hypothetical protein